MDRRDFLKMAIAGAVLHHVSNGAGAISRGTAWIDPATLADLDREDALRTLQVNVERHWLGPHFWGNRLQDWRLAGGRIECVHDAKGPDLRTVSLLTREFVEGNTGSSIRAVMGRMSTKGKGFGGFLVGAGAGRLDYRAAALVQRSSGEGGGILCVFDSDGKTRFREHTSEDAPLKYDELSSATTAGETRYNGGELVLTLEIEPQASSGDFALKLKAEENGQLVSTSILSDVKAAELLGGLMLVSASTSGPDTARFYFKDIDTSGEKIAHRPERALGPILGTLFSLNRNVLKMTAQLLPVAPGDPQDVTLSIRERESDEWREVASQKLGPGFCATLRVAEWDDQKDWQYRVSYAEDGTGRGRPMHYEGNIARDPRHAGRQLVIGLYSCTMAVARSLDGGPGRKPLPQSQDMGRYAPQSMYFPFSEMLNNSLKHDPDIAVFAGDQFYENNPTVKVPDESPLLDYLYKYYLWVWSFRELTRSKPTIVLIDDHDVYHGNIWGAGGRAAPEKKQELGGYIRAAAWVNMVQATQCGHNPDPWDPKPVDQGITVYYCAFKYGGVEFALLEDRKWKSPPPDGENPNVKDGELLGERQEKFLAEWAEKTKDSEARVILTQTQWGGVQTNPEGKHVRGNYDSNGYPVNARIRAVSLARDANALMLAGDQHLATVTRLGIETFTDGPVQFAGPAGHAAWTRWFQPVERLPNEGDTPYTGDFIDYFGNKTRVLAVANPRITFGEYRKHVKGDGQGVFDRNLKADGYGIVRVNLDKRDYTLECWRWDVDPASGAEQYPGWPLKFSFDEIARAKENDDHRRA